MRDKQMTRDVKAVLSDHLSEIAFIASVYGHESTEMRDVIAECMEEAITNYADRIGVSRDELQPA